MTRVLEAFKSFNSFKMFFITSTSISSILDFGKRSDRAPVWRQEASWPGFRAQSPGTRLPRSYPGLTQQRPPASWKILRPESSSHLWESTPFLGWLSVQYKNIAGILSYSEGFLKKLLETNPKNHTSFARVPGGLRGAREQCGLSTYQGLGDMVFCLSLAQGASYVGHSRRVTIKATHFRWPFSGRHPHPCKQRSWGESP